MMMFRFLTIFKIRNQPKEEKSTVPFFLCPIQTPIALWAGRAEGGIDIWGDLGLKVSSDWAGGQGRRPDMDLQYPDLTSCVIISPGPACEKIQTCQGYNPIMLMINNI